MSTTDTNITQQLSIWRLPSWFYLILFGICFYGLNCFELFFMYTKIIDVYSRTSMVPIYVLRAAILLFCVGGLIAILKNEKKFLESFHFPVLLILFWILYDIRFFYESFTRTSDITLYNNFDYLRPFTCTIMIWLPILICSSCIRQKLSPNIIYTFLVPLFIVNITLFFLVHNFIFDGLTSRSSKFGTGPTLWLDSVSPGDISRIGCLLTVFLFWAWSENKIRIPILLPCYVVGVLILFYGATRTFFVVSLFVHLFIIIFSSCRKRPYWLLTVLLIFCINILVFLWFFNATKERFIEEKVNLETVWQQIVEQSSENITTETQVSENRTTETQISEYKYEEPTLPIITSYKDYLVMPPSLEKMGSGRIGIWLTALDKLKQHPLTGTGTSVLGTMPHNNIVESFIATGIFGGFLFLIILFQGWRDAITLILKYPQIGWLSVAFIFCFFHQLLGTRIPTHHTLWISLAAMRSIVYFSEKELSTNTENKISNNSE
jgi:hypothetical protein